VLADALLRLNFRTRGPWVTRFRINGRAYGGWYDVSDDDRMREFRRRFEPCSVLELGCLEGGFTVELVRRGYEVTAVDGRPENLERARWISSRLSLDASFHLADLEQVRLRGFGRFDVVFCCGLLYHLPRPWELVTQLPSVAPRLFLSTHYAATEEEVVEGFGGRWYKELGREDPFSGLSRRSFWFTKPALLELLRASGYTRIEITHDGLHKNGPLLSLVALTYGRPV